MDTSSGEKIVVSGMSGIYPGCTSVKELSDILYNQVDPISCNNSRWKCDHPDIVQQVGQIPDTEMELFDAHFFKVHYHLGQHIDIAFRKLMEHAYHAIYDAGIPPAHLDGKKIAVFVGSGFSETEKCMFFGASERHGLVLLGCSKSMASNRISYWVNSKGPSVTVDQACCSSIAALELGFQAIQRGECEAAIIGGSNLCLHPQNIIHYRRMGLLSADGKTRSFDKNATGYARSEAINVLFLQKAKDAKRCYAEVVLAQSKFTALQNDDVGPKYGYCRDPEDTAEFLKRFYKEAKVAPQDVKYVEAFGSATLDADKAELDAFDEVFCKGRKDPLLVGSVLSNIGYTESASGTSAITKVLLAYNTGELAANMHCTSPRDDIASLRDGRMQIVTKNQTLDHSSYTAVNSLSYNGVNAHVLLRGYYKPKDLSRYKSTIPHLVLISGRQESSVQKVLVDLKSRSVDPEEIALFHNLHGVRQTGHLARGFTILDTNEVNETISLTEKVDYFDAATRPLWFVYSGMGSQWAGMGTQLLKIPIFAAAIEKCRVALEHKGVDLINIITSTDPKIFDNILNSFVGIAAIQIGLTDVLTELGIVPDNVIGHSVGELGCAYADGCLTAEEMVLSAYSRGLVSIESSLIVGAMAAVGLSYQEVLKMLPSDIEVACHNSSTSCTISGPADAVNAFVAKLVSQGIFAKEVPCSNIAYHSRYIAHVGPSLLSCLNEVIKTPKLRTKRWLSTSAPKEKWNEPSVMYNSPEYHTNNLLNPVLFEETASLIPSNAVLVEIAPHGLLQAILKRSLSVSCKNVSLTHRGHPNIVRYLLEAVGELYVAGYDISVQNLYPKVEFPVSTGTPMLSHFVDWAHNEKWLTAVHLSSNKRVAATSEFLISVHDDEHKYLTGHQIKDRSVYPFAAALIAVWDTFAMAVGAPRRFLSVQFTDVLCHSQPILSEQEIIRLSVSLHRGNGRFEVLNHKAQLISGFIKEADPKELKCDFEDTTNSENRICSDDVYKLFSLRDFTYLDDFRSIHSANVSLTNAQIVWRDNWVTFLDGMLQLNFLRQTYDNVSHLKFIKRIDMDINKHFSRIISLEDGTQVINAYVDELDNVTRSGGVYLNGIGLYDMPLKQKDTPSMNVLKFIPHFSKCTYDEASLQNIYFQIVHENLNKKIINILRIVNHSTYKSTGGLKFKDATFNASGHEVKLVNHHRNSVLNDSSLLVDVDLVLIDNLSTDGKMCQLLHRTLNQNTFIINKEEYSNETTTRPSLLFSVVCRHNTNCAFIELIRWRPHSSATGTSAISVFSQSDLPQFFATISDLPPKQNLIVFSTYPPLPKLKDTIKKYRVETNKHISLIMVNNNKSLSQYLDVPSPDLAFSVVNDDVVGGEYYLPIHDTFLPEGGMMLEYATVGDFNSLRWIETPESMEPGVPVKVHYAGLSTVDAKKVAGVIPLKEAKQNSCGMEFSGVVESHGTRVMGLVKNGSVKTRIRANPYLLWPVPKHWSLEEAATVPLAYSLAFYCLAIRSRLRPNMSIFVHGGTGALGQAVISIALAYGCEVFTTVSSISKKRFLRRLFPELRDDHIGNSRNDSFVDMVNVITKEKKCDIVICTVKGDLKTSTLQCCGTSGMTIDTSLLQDQEDYTIGMDFMWFSRGYATVDLSSIFSKEWEKNLMLQLLVSEGIARGYVRPISRVTYRAHDAPHAFRLLANGCHRGRVLLNLEEMAAPTVLPRLKCSAELCHLIISDNDALGIQLADKLISRGARKLYLQWKNPSTLLHFKSRSWQKQQVEVHISYDDIFDGDNACNMIQTLEKMGSTEGIYLLADKNYANEIENLFKHLSFLSKPFNDLLKYSAIVNVDNNSEENRCDLIYQTQMTQIKLPIINDFNYTKSTYLKNPISLRNAVEAIEFALAVKEPVLALSWSTQRITVLENIAAVAGMNIDFDDKSIQSTMTLHDLGLEPPQAEVVQAYLYYTHNILFSQDEVLLLTIKEIIEIDKNITDDGFVEQDKEGLWCFLSHLEPDELEASSNIVLMPTLTVNRSALYSGDFDVKQKYMCIVPGLEGNQERFGAICDRLKMAALVLQPGCDKPNETIQEIAKRLVQIIPTGNQDRKFYLLGYEYGVFVALEMAAILEDQGFTGILFCVGGAPDDILATFNEKLREFSTDEILQDAVLRHVFSLIVGDIKTELDAILSKVLTWEEKLEESIRVFRGRTGYANQYTRQLIETTYARLIQLRHYKSVPRRLRSQLVFIRPTSSTGGQPTSSLPVTYSQTPAVEYNLKVASANITKDLHCSSIINHHLDQDILEAFEKRNICNTYFLDVNNLDNIELTHLTKPQENPDKS